MTYDGFRGVAAKLHGAKREFEGLRAQVASYAQANSSRVVIKENPQRPQWAVKIADVDDAPIYTWGATIGRVIHDLRSALDHCCWMMSVRANGGVEPDETIARQIQFPIREPDRRYPGKHGQLLTRDDRRVIDPFQPDVRGDKSHPLTVLGYLSNQDKHRVVMLAKPTFEQTFLASEVRPDERGIEDIQFFPHVPIQKDAVLGEIIYAGSGQPDIGDYLDHTSYVAFADGTTVTPSTDADAINALELIWNHTLAIISAVQVTFD